MSEGVKWAKAERARKERYFMYALRPPAAAVEFIAEGLDLDELQAMARRLRLQGVRIVSPDDNRRETAEFFVRNVEAPRDGDGAF
jgi:hypothetical protein